MKVKELITRLLDEPMDAEISLCTEYDKEEITYCDNIRIINRGVTFDIDGIDHWTKDHIFINFTDWRKE